MQKAVEEIRAAGCPCTLGYLQDRGCPDPPAALHRYTVAGTGEPVYAITDDDVQVVRLQETIKELTRNRDELLSELGLSLAEAEAEQKAHIRRLHEYNGAKDVAQALLGRLAVLEGATVGEVHERFGVFEE